MKWYFAAPGSHLVQYLLDEKVEHILLSHALHKKMSDALVESAKKKKVEVMVDSGAFSYAIAHKSAPLEPYLEFLGTYKNVISECIVLDDLMKREVTLRNFEKMRKLNISNLRLVDHLWFKWAPALEAYYRDEDKLCWGGLAMGQRMKDGQNKVEKALDKVDWKGFILKRAQFRFEKAFAKPFTAVHLLGVGQRLKRFLPFFDVVDSFDSASWTVAPGAYGRWPKFYPAGTESQNNVMPMIRFYLPPWKGPRPPKDVYEQAEAYGLDLHKWQGRTRMAIREFKKYYKALEEFHAKEKSKGAAHLLEVSLHKDIEGDFEPLYRVYVVQLQAKSDRAQQADEARSKDKLTVGEFFYQPKPTRAAFAEELQSVERLVALYKERAEKWLPTLVQKKYDGARHQIHKDGDKVWIFSEEGEDNTARLPSVVEEVKKLKSDKLIADAEIEAWDGSHHLPREVIAGYLHSEDEPDDSQVIVNVFDPLLTDTGDIHKEPVTERVGFLPKLGFGQSTMGVPDTKIKLNLAPSVEVKDADELEKAVRRIRALPGSEGTVMKQVDSGYPLDVKTLDTWVKFHNATTVRGIVYGSEKTKAGTWVYQYGVKPGKEKPKETVKAGSVEVVPVGDTFMTNRRFSTGDGILVEAETVNLTRGPEGIEITAWVPRVIGEWTGAHDTVDSAAARARSNLVLSLKEIKDGETVYVPTRKVEKQQDPYLEIPPETKKYRYSVQHHYRGKGFHADLRLELRPKTLLAGWTMNVQIAGSVKEPVTSLSQAKALDRNMDEISKVNWNTGEWASRPKAGTDKLVRAEILSERKAPEPYAWIDVEGKTKEPEPGKAPPVGGTRQYPGVFDIVDQGEFEYGAQKPWFHEYFFHGKGLNYRMFFRLLKIARKSEGSCAACRSRPVQKALSWADEQEETPLCNECASEFLTKQGVVLPPSEEQPMADEAAWLAIYPDDQMPYVLDQDAVKKNWMPSDGYSAMPAEMRKQIPTEYRYWTRKGAKAKALRDELVQKIADGEVRIDVAAPYKKVEKASMLDADFVLQEQTWRGPLQVRIGPSRTRWWVRLDVGRPSLLVFDLKGSPFDNAKLAALVTEDSHKESMKLEGNVPPGHYLNPTKQTPSTIEIQDKGKAEVLALSDDLIKVQFKGGRLKGVYTLKRNNSEYLWERAQAAPEPTTKRLEFELYIPFDHIEVRKAADGTEKRLVTGIVLEPDVVDAQGDFIGEEAIEKAAHEFLKEYNKTTGMGLMHKVFGDIGIELVESSIAPLAYTLGSKPVKKGSWVVTVHVSDDKRWKEVKDGKLTGFSVGGVATVAGNP